MFLWCHGRYLNLVERNPQRIRKEDKESVSKLDYEGINFPVSKKKIIVKLKSKIISVLICFVMRINELILLIYQIKSLKVVYICY